MLVRIVELITKPNQTKEICRLFDHWALPLARMFAGFREGMCLTLRPEPRILAVFTQWDSEADADWYFEHVYPAVASMLRPLVDEVTVRDFDLGVVVTAARPPQSAAAASDQLRAHRRLG